VYSAAQGREMCIIEVDATLGQALSILHAIDLSPSSNFSQCHQITISVPFIDYIHTAILTTSATPSWGDTTSMI